MSINLSHQCIAAILFVLLTIGLIEAAPQPKFSLLPITPTSVEIHQYDTVDIVYLVTNNTSLTRTLTMAPIIGVTQNIAARTCGQPFTLAPQEQCLLSLTVDGIKLSSSLVEGPKICKTRGPTDSSPDLFLCSQPSSNDRLQISLLPAQLSSLLITPANRTIPNGTSQQFIASALYSDGVAQDLTQRVQWNSSNTHVAMISNNQGTQGLAHAIGGGNTHISASIGRTSASTQLMVPAALLQSIDVSPDDSTMVDTLTQQFSASGHYSDSSIIDITDFVTWRSSDLSIAQISAGGLAHRESQGGGITSIRATLNTISGTTNLTLPSITYAYLTNSQSNTITKCPINTDGRFGACSIAGNGFNTPLSVSFNCPGTLAYVTNFANNSVSTCAVSTNGDLTLCTQTGGFNKPISSTIDYADTWLYLSNQGTNTLLACMLDATTGAIGTCTPSPAAGSPAGLTLNRAGDFIYMTNRDASTLSRCAVTSTGLPGTCNATGPTVNNATDVALNAAGTFAYILDSTSITQCAIDAVTDELSSSCATSMGSSALTSIAINDDDSFAYITNSTSDEVNLCSLNQTTGAINSCVGMKGDFTAPHSITLHSALPSANCPG